MPLSDIHMFFAKIVTMGSLQELRWQKRVRTRSCGEFHPSNSISQRRRSAPSINVSKALSKTKPVYRDCVSQVCQDPHALIQSLLGPSRSLISRGNVLLQTGVQTQERYLLLFTDLLIITKAKSVMQVKQKACVCVSEMWTASCVDEVCEANTITDRSFVMGWPTYNCVATFSTPEEKERWLSLIESCIKEEKKYDDPKIISLEIFAKDVDSCDYAKTVSISNTDCASDIIIRALEQFGLSGGIRDYQLWVCSNKDETPYPLIGHEFPYSIKMSHMRALQQDAETTSHRQEALLSIDSYCQFFLRPRQMSGTGEQKSRKRRMSLISWAFKRGLSIEQDVYSESPTSPGHTMTSTSGHLFGRPLQDVIKDNTLPSPIMDLLMCLCNEGAVTRGIFRRSAGVKACRELREKLDSGHHERPLNEESLFVTAAVFKDFLRNIPGSLLCEELYGLWLRAMEHDDKRYGLMLERKQLQEVQRLLQLLPKENLLLLRHVIAMLHHIQLNAEHNQMNSFNLAVCIAPSFLWNSSLQTQEDEAKKVCDLLRFLIDNCRALFGDDIVTLLKDFAEDNRSKYGSVGSLQQMSDSGYDSLKSEMIADTEDILKNLPHKDSRSMDSLISVSDCDLDCPDDELETDSSHPQVQMMNVTLAVHSPQSHELHRHSVPLTGHDFKPHEQEENLQRGKCHNVEKPEDETEDNVLLERSFQQLKLVSGRDGVGQHRVKQTSSPLLRQNTPSSSVSSPLTSPAGLSVNSKDSGFSLSANHLRSSLKIFHSPQNSPPKRQSNWFRRNSADYQHPIRLLNENLCLSHHQRDSTHFEGGLHHKPSRNRSPPSYQHALLHLKRKPVSQTPTQVPVKSTGQLHKGRSFFYKGPVEDQQGFPAPQTFKPTSTTSETAGRDPTYMKSKTEEKIRLPESMFYGQSCKLTVHKVRGENLPVLPAGSKTGSFSEQQRKIKGFDVSPLGDKATKNQADGRSRRLRRCSSTQWVGELGFHAEESYV